MSDHEGTNTPSFSPPFIYVPIKHKSLTLALERRCLDQTSDQPGVRSPPPGGLSSGGSTRCLGCQGTCAVSPCTWSRLDRPGLQATSSLHGERHTKEQEIFNRKILFFCCVTQRKHTG